MWCTILRAIHNDSDLAEICYGKSYYDNEKIRVFYLDSFFYLNQSVNQLQKQLQDNNKIATCKNACLKFEVLCILQVPDDFDIRNGEYSIYSFLSVKDRVFYDAYSDMEDMSSSYQSEFVSFIEKKYANRHIYSVENNVVFVPGNLVQVCSKYCDLMLPIGIRKSMPVYRELDRILNLEENQAVGTTGYFHDYALNIEWQSSELALLRITRTNR